MALFDFFKFNKKHVGQLPQNYTHAKFIEGTSPIFISDNREIYSDDIVQTCISRLATEISKWEPQHNKMGKDNSIKRINSSIGRLLEFAPNNTMNTSDFLAKCIWMLYLNYNCFILPTWIETGGKRIYTGLHVLDPVGVDYLQDTTGKLFIKFRFNSNHQSDPIAYSDIIHLKKDLSLNPVMGGGLNGTPDNEGIKQTVKTNSVVIEGLDKGMRLSMAIRGVLKLNASLKDTASKAAVEKLEQDVLNSELPIIASTSAENFIATTINPKLIDKETLAFIQNKILSFYGVSLPIFNGDFNDEQFEAFFNATIEPLAKLFDREFSRVIFTDSELDVGNRIRFYTKSNAYLSTKSKLELIKVAGEQGLLSDNDKLAILGYQPIEGGEQRRVSLNYINSNIADEYQLARARMTPDRISESGKKINEDYDD